jgi:hypothetical protein
MTSHKKIWNNNVVQAFFHISVYISEAWTIRNADEKRLRAAEMKFMRKTAGLTLWDHKRNEVILKKL